MLLSTTTFGPVSFYRKIAQAEGKAYIDPRENFRKQTDRNRYRIATATGPQTLSIPVEGSKHANIRDIRISDHNNWRHLHWQALCTAYGSSPFFEYYADDIEPFFHKRSEEDNAQNRYDHSLLFDYNMDIIETLCPLLGIETPQITTEEGCRIEEYAGLEPVPYYQVFQSRQGFLPDMSILDLLFNMGPESILVLLRK